MYKINKTSIEVLKKIFDRFIPNSKKEKMPCFSKVVNCSDFVMNLNKNNKIHKSFIIFLNKETKKYNQLNSANIKKVEKIFGNYLIQSYFSSKKIVELLNKNKLKSALIKNYKEKKIAKLIKNSYEIKYKNI